MNFRRVFSPASLARFGRVIRQESSHSSSTPPKIRTQEEISAWVKKEIEKGGWQGFGIFPTDKTRDYRAGHFFFLISVCMFLLPAFWWRYMNDQARTDWAHREAMILLREREAAGIFPIDKNFVDPQKLELPTDEELGDTPIYC